MTTSTLGKEEIVHEDFTPIILVAINIIVQGTKTKKALVLRYWTQDLVQDHSYTEVVCQDQDTTNIKHSCW